VFPKTRFRLQSCRVKCLHVDYSIWRRTGRRVGPKRRSIYLANLVISPLLQLSVVVAAARQRVWYVATCSTRCSLKYRIFASSCTPVELAKVALNRNDHLAASTTRAALVCSRLLPAMGFCCCLLVGLSVCLSVCQPAGLIWFPRRRRCLDNFYKNNSVRNVDVGIKLRISIVTGYNETKCTAPAMLYWFGWASWLNSPNS